MKIQELRDQVKGWRKEMDNLEDMIEAAYQRIDELEDEKI